MFAYSCGEATVTEEEYIVKVKSDQLSKTDFYQLTGKEFDSVDENLKKKYIDLWIKEQLILDEINSRNSQSKEIDQLVEAYRNSLLIQHQKDRVIQQNVDTVVGEKEIDSLYLELNSDFEQKQKLLKAEIFVFPVEDENVIDAKIFFSDKKWIDFYHLVDENPDYARLDSINYVDWSNLKMMLPGEFILERELQEDTNYFGQEGERYFFVKIYKIIDKNEIPPLDYLEEKLKSAILHQRIKKYLESYENELYKKALQKNQIKFY